jgi:hypothetical protein
MNNLLKSTLLIGAVVLMAATAFANQVWTVESGSYMSISPVAITSLLHTRHGTSQYRHFRDSLITNGLLQPVSGYMVSVIASNGEISQISGVRYADGTPVIFYIPNEDLISFVRDDDGPSVVAPFSLVSPE